MSYVRIALWLMYVQCRALLESLVPAYMYVNRVFHRLLVSKGEKKEKSGKSLEFSIQNSVRTMLQLWILFLLLLGI